MSYVLHESEYGVNSDLKVYSMVRQKPPLCQHGLTYDIIFSLVRQMTPIFPFMVVELCTFLSLIHVQCSCRVLTPIFSLKVRVMTPIFIFL